MTPRWNRNSVFVDLSCIVVMCAPFAVGRDARARMKKRRTVVARRSWWWVGGGVAVTASRRGTAPRERCLPRSWSRTCTRTGHSTRCPWGAEQPFPRGALPLGQVVQLLGADALGATGELEDFNHHAARLLGRAAGGLRGLGALGGFDRTLALPGGLGGALAATLPLVVVLPLVGFTLPSRRA